MKERMLEKPPARTACSSFRRWDRAAGQVLVHSVGSYLMAPAFDPGTWNLKLGTSRLRQIPQLLAGLESDGVAGRDGDLDARLGVPADATLPALDLKDAKPPQLDPVPRAQRGAHGFDHCLDRGRRF